mmetsp:Transcript_20296/g.44306  ORF Transcript_20296/g.44306 Transcript_20296/m.44306 type:complete len:210 (-) Transcript_20296:676-1305(-)
MPPISEGFMIGSNVENVIGDLHVVVRGGQAEDTTNPGSVSHVRRRAAWDEVTTVVAESLIPILLQWGVCKLRLHQLSIDIECYAHERNVDFLHPLWFSRPIVSELSVHAQTDQASIDGKGSMKVEGLLDIDSVDPSVHPGIRRTNLVGGRKLDLSRELSPSVNKSPIHFELRRWHCQGWKALRIVGCSAYEGASERGRGGRPHLEPQEL